MKLFVFACLALCAAIQVSAAPADETSPIAVDAVTSELATAVAENKAAKAEEKEVEKAIESAVQQVEAKAEEKSADENAEKTKDATQSEKKNDDNEKGGLASLVSSILGSIFSSKTNRPRYVEITIQPLNRAETCHKIDRPNEDIIESPVDSFSSSQSFDDESSIMSHFMSMMNSVRSLPTFFGLGSPDIVVGKPYNVHETSITLTRERK